MSVVACGDDIINIRINKNRRHLRLIQMPNLFTDDVAPLEGELVVFLAEEDYPCLIFKLVVHVVRVDEVEVVHFPRQLRKILQIIIKSFQIFFFIIFFLGFLAVFVGPEGVFVPFDWGQILKLFNRPPPRILRSKCSICLQHVFWV